MKPLRVLFSNIGYAKGMNGCLSHHVLYAYRHFYCPPDTQRKVLAQISELIETEDPDLCCLVEIDQGAFSYSLNQMEELLNEHYRFFDIENKYGELSRLRALPLTRGKSNGFLSKREFPHDKTYFTVGAKRLVYRIRLEEDVTLLFAHFSLKKAVRAQQLVQMRQMIDETPGEVILLGDFNILTGLAELAPLLSDGELILLNREDSPTFNFAARPLLLDLCLCSRGVAQHSHLRIIPQPYSDHAALLLEVLPH